MAPTHQWTIAGKRIERPRTAMTPKSRLTGKAVRVSDQGLPILASEDFAYFAQAAPATYFLLGAGVEGEDTPSCHHPDFDFDDDLISKGVAVFVGLVEDRLAAMRDRQA